MVEDASIQVVDSNEDDLFKTCDLLKYAGYQVKRDSSPKRALERLNNYKPDCIVVDAELEEMSGLEFVQAVKSNPTLFDTPIVVLTSSVNLGHVLKLLQHGVDDYIHKSLEPEIFMAKIKSFLRLSKLQNEMVTLSTAKDDFLRMVSNTLVHPISFIRQSMQLMMDEKTKLNDDEKRDLIVKSNGLANYSIGLIGDLMDHWKVKHGIKLSNENVKIKGLISTSVEYFKFAAREKEVTIETNFNDDYEVYADPARIVQVVNNLLANAIKFSPVKGKVCISVVDDSTGKKTGKLHITVTDEGAGFDEVEIKSVLSNEVTAEGGRVGEGIGLPISRQIIELHNGKMWVENGSERGAVFHVTIPHIIRSAESEKEKTHSILLVDDIEEIRKSTKETFEKLGFEVSEASNGKEALELIQKTNPDLILTDLDMPVMNGVSLMQAVKSNDLTKNIPIIVFTAKSKQTELDNYYRLAQDFIFKPGTLSEFAHKTKEVLHLSADFDVNGATIDPNRKSVLVVDDEEDIRELIVDSIEGLQKYNVISAKNGIEALFMFKKYKIDLVLSDMTMPIMNGIEFAHYVKEMSKTPVVFVTAQTREIEKKKGATLDVNEIIAKPFKSSDIKTVVGKYLP